ncbi:MAG: flagellar basal body P-ring formation protein FlgA [Deltaproteobacteria bacterium]|nr:flagellar basal body P-ring formation protein FlgA [Deltaproteobacteria bacterium]
MMIVSRLSLNLIVFSWPFFLLAATTSHASSANVQEDQQAPHWEWAEKLKDMSQQIPASDHLIRLKMKHAVSTDADILMLSDLTDCLNESCKNLTDISISEAPKAGQSLLLSSDLLSRKIKEQWPDLIADISGSDDIQVTATSREISSEELREQLIQNIDLIQKKFKSLRIIIEKINIHKKTLVRPGKKKIVFHELEEHSEFNEKYAARLFSHLTKLTFKIFSDKNFQEETTGSASVRFRIKYKAFIANKDISQSSVISEEDFTEAWVAETNPGHSLITDLPAPLSYMTKKVLHEGEALRKYHLTRYITVRRGQMLNMSIKNSGIEITMRVRAQEPGSPGDTIRVICPPTKKNFYAKIEKDHTLTMTTKEAL